MTRGWWRLEGGGVSGLRWGGRFERRTTTINYTLDLLALLDRIDPLAVWNLARLEHIVAQLVSLFLGALALLLVLLLCPVLLPAD